MYFSLGGFLSLRPLVFVGLVVFWCLLSGLSLYLNGGFGLIRNPTAAVVAATTCIVTSIFCFLVMTSGVVQRFAIRLSDREIFDRSSFFFVGAIALLLGTAIFMHVYEVAGFKLPSNTSLVPTSETTRHVS